MKRSAIRIGTRGSLLALAQSGLVMRALKKYFPKKHFKLVVIKTLGDEYQGVELFKKNNVGVFTKKLQDKLISKKIDIAVHSLKDMPTDLPESLILAAYPKRADTRDCLVTKGRIPLARLPKGAVVGTGSARRKSQLLRLRPDLKLVDLRGNLDTRVGHAVKEGKMDAVILARAGLIRTKKYLKYAASIPLKTLMPAVGQGALGIEVRKDNGEVFIMARRLNHAETETAVLAERAFLKKLRGGCRVPVGVISKVNSKNIRLHAAVFSVKSRNFITVAMKGSVEDAIGVGERCASALLKKGAARFLREARGAA